MTYHYQALSQDSEGVLASSPDFTFTTISGPTILLQVNGTASEVSGVVQGSVVTPSIAPSGFTGTVAVNGSGSVNFAGSGSGVYFLNCCSNTNNAYFKFTGAAIGSLFNAAQGQISFDLTSRYSFAQRSASAASARYAFDVRDGGGAHLFYFVTQVASGRLIFTWAVDGVANYYYVPAGTEDALFGSNVALPVTITWSSGSIQLYLNNQLIKSGSYTPGSPSWTSASSFDLGAYEYLTSGGYNVSDDAISQFTVQ
jgi:hypothetical protein